MGLLDDDREYVDAFIEVSSWGSAHYMRKRFATLLLAGVMYRPEIVLEATWNYLSEDILHHQRRFHQNQDLQLNDDQLKNFTLAEIEKILQKNRSSLAKHPNMPLDDDELINDGRNRLLQSERNYDRLALSHEHDVLLGKMTTEQKGEIVLPAASSGIASLLLPGGKTAHSMFRIPLTPTESSTCDIRPGTELAELLRQTKLIIWDEAPMLNPFCFEALDRTLRDILRSPTKPFGGKVIVFGGDFRQILPVIPKGSRQDIVLSAINASYLWSFCKVLKLTKNMRLLSSNTDVDLAKVKEFSDWILKLGDGLLGDPNDAEATIEIPEEILIREADNPIAAIVESTYPSADQNVWNANYFQERAILAPTHETVYMVNDYLLTKVQGEEKVYLSSDSICRSEILDAFDESAYSTEFLNSIRCPGLPNHELKLKIGVPVMLPRNLDQAGGLCNGTRLVITKLGERVIEGEIISGRNIGHKVAIARMTLSPSDTTQIHVKLRRKQFPIVVSFAMTINKSQGQSLSRVGLFLPKPVFSHGQLLGQAFVRLTWSLKSELRITSSCTKPTVIG
ncbi:uncharacterized protein LOC141655509 [Silene latifolia]|uniref:uncharacterized protein LOC141655509 n=1 Tax=Silene latifolia TaxID=37657 RepID=UPI003D77396A